MKLWIYIGIGVLLIIVAVIIRNAAKKAKDKKIFDQTNPYTTGQNTEPDTTPNSPAYDVYNQPDSTDNLWWKVGLTAINPLVGWTSFLF